MPEGGGYTYRISAELVVRHLFWMPPRALLLLLLLF